MKPMKVKYYDAIYEPSLAEREVLLDFLEYVRMVVILAGGELGDLHKRIIEFRRVFFGEDPTGILDVRGYFDYPTLIDPRAWTHRHIFRKEFGPIPYLTPPWDMIKEQYGEHPSHTWFLQFYNRLVYCIYRYVDGHPKSHALDLVNEHLGFLRDEISRVTHVTYEEAVTAICHSKDDGEDRFLSSVTTSLAAKCLRYFPSKSVSAAMVCKFSIITGPTSCIEKAYDKCTFSSIEDVVGLELKEASEIIGWIPPELEKKLIKIAQKAIKQNIGTNQMIHTKFIENIGVHNYHFFITNDVLKPTTELDVIFFRER